MKSNVLLLYLCFMLQGLIGLNAQFRKKARCLAEAGKNFQGVALL